MRVQSVMRALQILDQLASAAGGLTLSQLARRLDLPVSTTHRLLRTLEDGRLVGMGADKLWRLRPARGPAHRPPRRRTGRPVAAGAAVDLSLLAGSGGNKTGRGGVGYPSRPQRRQQEMDMKTLAEAFHHTLKDIYYAENAILKSGPKVAQKVSTAALKKAIDDHMAETREQIGLLERVFAEIGEKPEGEKCDAIEGLIKETDGILEEAEGVALDAAAIGALQAIEHYEISRYGTLREWAHVLGEDEAHDLLTQILDQEKGANAKLTTVAVSAVNDASEADVAPRKGRSARKAEDPDEDAKPKPAKRASQRKSSPKSK